MQPRGLRLWLWLWGCVGLRLAAPQDAEGVPEPGCCEGELLFLVDSSGSVSSYEFLRLRSFLGELMSPFQLGGKGPGVGGVRVGLVQVGTEPRLEFGLDEHADQASLQRAIAALEQLGGDTNTASALELVWERVLAPGWGPGKARQGLPRVLVWLTDGVLSDPVLKPMARLREDGVAVLAVSTGHGNYQYLSSVVTPPSHRHLYFIDIDHMSIITAELRQAIIDLLRVARLWVTDVGQHSAVLQWHPVLEGEGGFYQVLVEQQGGLSGSQRTLTLDADASSVQLTDLQPDTIYSATLIPESNQRYHPPLNTTFTTLSEELSPVWVQVSESSPHSVQLSWGPVQPGSVQRYQVQYSTLPRGEVRTVELDPLQNHTVLTDLQPDAQYLVTVSAMHNSGQERALSVKACTQEVLPALSDLQLTPVGVDAVRVSWRGGEGGVRGYWLSWETEYLPGPPSSRLLPPNSLSTLLSDLPPHTRVCVSPVYKSARGQGLCCTANLDTDSVPWGFRTHTNP
ncbi:von Willebrand factor A domain-containing protein 1 [Amia ocellicauda]|uniref:von Willebrand factor A domain-containing protein 1 n=1 Tax=Amia ocellicauda TaxID=2972642 RepID=UPI003464711F